MPDPIDQQKAIERLTQGVREELQLRHSTIFENLRLQMCPDASDQEALETVLPHMAEHVGAPDAEDLSAVVEHDLRQRSWAIELGAKERWTLDEVIVRSDQSDQMERNMAEGLDPDTDRLEVLKAREAAATARLAAHDQKVSQLGDELKEIAQTLGRLLELPPEASVREIFERLDQETGSELLDLFAEVLLPKIREANKLDHDPPQEEVREILLAMLDEL